MTGRVRPWGCSEDRLSRLGNNGAFLNWVRPLSKSQLASGFSLVSGHNQCIRNVMNKDCDCIVIHRSQPFFLIFWFLARLTFVSYLSELFGGWEWWRRGDHCFMYPGRMFRAFKISNGKFSQLTRDLLAAIK